MHQFQLSYQNVFDYLISQGLCTQDEQSLSEIELKPAKNFNLLLSLPQGQKLLIKQERYNKEGKTTGEFATEWRIHEFLQEIPEINHIRPLISEAVHFDSENFIIVFNYLNNYRDLLDFYVKENFFPSKIATILGTTLASIHRITFNRQDYREFFQNQDDASSQPPNLTRGLDRIGPEIFGKVPADGIKFFTLYQRYDSLKQAIASLSSAFTACCLTHNDLKLNNILLSLNWEEAIFNDSLTDESMIRIIDWESCAWGDPANDLGTAIASYLQIWLSSMITSEKIPINESLRLATTPLHLIQPSIAALVTAYLTNFPEIIESRPDFLQRVIQFSGLALIKAIRAKLQHEKTFDYSGNCTLQVAKSLLCRPEASMPTIFGLETKDRGMVARN